jgi:hypothetical protein
MNTSPEPADLEEITRFLHRFADLMSNGSNSDNLLRAARLLENSVKRASEAEDLLKQQQSNCARLESGVADLTARLAAVQGVLARNTHILDTHVLAPISVLRLAAAQFEALSRAFEKSGNTVSQVMCSASASTLARVLETDTPQPAIPAQAEKAGVGYLVG